MFDAVALRGFTNDLTVRVAGLTGEATRALLIDTAAAARDRVLAGAPKPSSWRQVVDGRAGAALTVARPASTIVFAWQYLDTVVADTYGALVNRAPRDIGTYIAGLLVFADGEEIAPDAPLPADTRRVIIVASVPYARRLEVGRRKDHTPFVVQVAPHIVEETAIVARRLWGDLAEFAFNYIDLSDAHALTAAGMRRRRWREGVGWRAGSVRRGETTVRFPAILITPRAA